MDSLETWMRSGEYLPPPIRDFHDQKDLFKAIHALVDVEGHGLAKSVDWVTGQCYVIDVFLWFMARRGYTLQRSRKRLGFRSLADDLDPDKARRDAANFFAAIADNLNAAPKAPA